MSSKLKDIIFDYRLNVSRAEQSQGGDGDLEAINKAEAQALQQIKSLFLEITNNCQERGFGIPQQGEEDFKKGTFTKLISEQELRKKIEDL